MLVENNSYEENGCGITYWECDDVPIEDARQLNKKAETLWNSTIEAYKAGYSPHLKLCSNLNRYGRTLRNMFNCDMNNQPTSQCIDLIYEFLVHFSNETFMDFDDMCELVKEGLGEEWEIFT